VLSDHVLSFAGRSITITSHDLLLAGFSVLIGLVFWAALHFHRKRVVVLQRSGGVEQVTLELSRIADALERLANQPADRAISRAIRRQQQQRTDEESGRMPYSMFGR